ncbi:acyl-CoA dehydrogenase family protein [Aromatoleum toluvorans]|nr:acyl-CoA dehydrogenase family protein [Aromatoleum toluvorans]
MRFAFNEEQEMLRDAIRVALQREAGLDKIRRWVDAADLSPFDACAVGNAWVGIGVAEELGGQGGGRVEQALMFEELGRAVAPSGVLLAGAGGALGFAVRLPGGAEFLREVLDGEGTGVLCVPAGRPADEGALQVQVAGGRLSGVIPMVLEAPGASHLLVPLPSGDGLDLWLVPDGGSDVDIKPRRMIDRTRRFGDVRLQQAKGIRIGRLDRGAAQDANAVIALLVAAESLGLARRMLDMTVEYVGQRVQFGVPVASFQAVKHAAAEALVDIEAAHSGVYYAAWALQEGQADGVLHAWIAKAFATEAAVRTADRALLLHGAIGYTWEHDLQLFYKRAKLNLELFGSPRSYRERMAEVLALH